jgi:hypothetical protein
MLTIPPYGGSATGRWIFTGSWSEKGNLMARRDNADPFGIGQTLNWAYAWPANRRILYNRASCDPSGKPYDPKRKLIGWDAAAKWTGSDIPDFKVDSAPEDGMNPFIMNPEGVARFFALDKMAEGPFPEHYEPMESPLPNNPMHPDNPKSRANPAARVFKGDWESFGKAEQFPYVGTTYRLTEHFHFWTKHVQSSAIIQPEHFVEIGEELAKEKGIKAGDKVRVKSMRGFIIAVAVVTKRIRSLTVDGKRVHTVGIPLHWGFMGVAKLIDISKCIGCKACQVAYMQWNDLRDEVGNNAGVYDNPRDLSASSWTVMRFSEVEIQQDKLEWLIRKDGCRAPSFSTATALWISSRITASAAATASRAARSTEEYRIIHSPRPVRSGALPPGVLAAHPVVRGRGLDADSASLRGGADGLVVPRAGAALLAAQRHHPGRQGMAVPHPGNGGRRRPQHARGRQIQRRSKTAVLAAGWLYGGAAGVRHRDVAGVVRLPGWTGAPGLGSSRRQRGVHDRADHRPRLRRHLGERHYPRDVVRHRHPRLGQAAPPGVVPRGLGEERRCLVLNAECLVGARGVRPNQLSTIRESVF